MSGNWHVRACAALEAFTDPGEFTASTLPSIIRGHERPDIDTLWRNYTTKTGSYEAYKVAVDEWKAGNPGQSDGNMRRVCDRLVSEGVLICRADVRGWYVRHFYRRATPEANHE